MKKIICLLVVAIAVLSWVAVISNGKNNHHKYNSLLENAEALTQDELYIDALACYNNALELNSDIVIRFKILDLYNNLNMFSTFESYAKEIYYETKSIDAVLKLCDYYNENGSYDKAIELLVQSKSDYELSSSQEEVKKIKERLDKLAGVYTKKYEYFDNISEFYDGYAITSKADKYGIIDLTGKTVLKPQFADISIFNNAGDIKLAPVREAGEEEKEYFYVDEKGYKRKILKSNYSYAGAFSDDGYALVIKDDGYTFIDQSLNEISDCYDFATPFSDGISVIRDKKGYRIINNKFELISDAVYDGVILNELGYASSCNMLFMKKNGKYMLVKSNGQEITAGIYDDARMFINRDEYASVKINSKWGYIDYSGKIVIEPSYSMACSFSCGLAPVMIGDLWGYINKDNTIVIEPEFANAKAFSAKGYAPVCKTQWYVIGLEYYER